MTTTPRLRFADVKADLEAVGVTIGRTQEPGEFKVRLRGSPRGEGYFTFDLEDARGTGLDMARRHAAGGTL